MITGTMILRNAVLLGYPFEVAIRSLQQVSDRVVVSVDPTSEDDTLAIVRGLGVDVFESVWDLDDPGASDPDSTAGQSCEIARQTQLVCDQVKEGWNFSLQADEVLHEKDVDEIRRVTQSGEHTGYALSRLYFFARLTWMRDNWTLPIIRLFKHDLWLADPDSGGMTFVPVGPQPSAQLLADIYHYSRVGDPAAISRRVRNLDAFYHAEEKLVPVDDLPEYTFDLHKLDNAAIKGSAPAHDPEARLVPFPVDGHPAAAREHYKNYA